MVSEGERRHLRLIGAVRKLATFLQVFDLSLAKLLEARLRSLLGKLRYALHESVNGLQRKRERQESESGRARALFLHSDSVTWLVVSDLTLSPYPSFRIKVLH